jgi:hypothetical protein
MNEVKQHWIKMGKDYRACYSKGYTITVDNSKTRSFNVNIDSPSFFCFAISKAEAIGLMMLSDFEHKNKAITRIETM